MEDDTDDVEEITGRLLLNQQVNKDSSSKDSPLEKNSLFLLKEPQKGRRSLLLKLGSNYFQRSKVCDLDPCVQRSSFKSFDREELGRKVDVVVG